MVMTLSLRPSWTVTFRLKPMWKPGHKNCPPSYLGSHEFDRVRCISEQYAWSKINNGKLPLSSLLQAEGASFAPRQCTEKVQMRHKGMFTH